MATEMLDCCADTVVILVRVGSLANEATIATMLRKHGHLVIIVRTVDELVRTMEEQTIPTVLVVDATSVEAESDSPGGYDWFLHIYAHAREDWNTPLIVIHPQKGDMGLYIGYGDLVSGYVSTPIDPSYLLTLVDRVFGMT